MQGKQFIGIVAVITVIFIFAKIYQQNRTIQVRYDLQRLERSCDQLVKACNQQNIALVKLKDPMLIKQKALSLGFVPIAQKQFVTTAPSSNL